MDLMKSIENFSKLAAAVSILLVIFGYLGLVLFYITFNIDVSSFISISEIITISFSFLITFLIPLVISFFIMREWLIVFRNQNSAFTNQYKGFYLNAVIILSLVFSGLIFLEPFINLYNYLGFLINFLALIALYNIVIHQLFKIILKSNKQAFKKYYMTEISKFTLIMYLLSAPLTLFYAYGSKFTRVLLTKDSVKTKIYLNNNSVIVTNDTLKYLGKTEKYFFIWNKKSKTSTIYPVSEVSKFEIKP